MKYCSSCGSELPEGSLTCPQCNADQSPAPAPPPLAAAPVQPPPAAPPIQAPPGAVPIQAGATKTSGLAIASLVLALLGFFLLGLPSLLGIILGIVALSKIKKSNGQLGGRGLAIAGICVGGAICALMFLMLAAIVIPNFLKFSAKAKQSEAKMNLGAIFTCEVAYFGENNTYGSTFEQLSWAPEGENRYAYFIAGDVIQARAGGSYQLPPGIESYASEGDFQALAIGNIDNDDTLDVWAIDDRKHLQNLVNDTMQ